MTVPIASSPGRSGFGPQLNLTYDSGSGNSPFGFGWSLSLPSITRKTDKGLPQYHDGEDSDVFILSGAEDLVPVLDTNGDKFEDSSSHPGYKIHRYRPRIEGLFARIERWTDLQTGESHWRSISKDNITTWYGKTAESRIADPTDATRIFSWLVCESYDDKGNQILYQYKEEDALGVDLTQAHEKNRPHSGSLPNRYLKRIQYGNKVSRLAASYPAGLSWMFEVVFDYGEGHYAEDQPDAEQRIFAQAHFEPPAGTHWPVRPDPFSTYRAGFEVRSYRRCQRVLMFHHFAELGTDACLVRSTEFEYADLNYSQPTTINAELVHQGSTRFASFIQSVTQSGYVRQPLPGQPDRYLKKSLPPLEFEYSKAVIQEDIRELDAAGLENLPSGLDGSTYQWVDLDGEGLSGILTEQAEAWFYKRNLGDGHFGPLETVAAKPSLAALTGGRQQLLDLAGDGQLDLVAFAGPTPGFFERTPDQDWESFTPFKSLPNLAWNDPNLRFVDLNGDGHADVLISEDEALTWYPSLAEAGFAAAQQVRTSLDEEQGPRLVFADGTQSIYLADMSADGLTDLVRIRNSEVCYWPNLGYGRFGARVVMDNAPWFDAPDQFNQQHIRLADIDGSGANDIIYLGREGVRLYFNQSGNRWSAPRSLEQFPPVDNLASVMTADLLGNGTACLVWSSPLPGNTRRPMRYIDLMGGQKPHLLIRSINNLGAETCVKYASSTKFYLDDKRNGQPWITKLPFPVHVVERVETYDYISRNHFVTHYAYHHGYFDGVEREFRGFGMVEQFDTEKFAALSTSDLFPTGDNVDAASHVPPAHTKTWFHTGAFFNREHISNFFAGLINDNDQGEYYREPGLNNTQARALLLADTVLPDGLSAEEEREACRAIKGVMLRQEVYAEDDSDKAQYPYTVTEQNFTIQRLQPQAGNRHAVFFTHPREAISYHCERNPADPRVTRALTLEVDDFGNVLRALAIGYGRGQSPLSEQRDKDKQTTTLITYTESSFTNAIDDLVKNPDDYRAPLLAETRTYELTGFKPANNAKRFSFDEWAKTDFALLKSALEIAYQETADLTNKQKRLIEHVRARYRKNDLSNLLSLNEVESLGLPGENYKLAFTPGLLAQVFKRKQAGQPDEDLLPNPAPLLEGTGDDQGGYLAEDGNWWIPTGRVFYSEDSNDAAVQELAVARAHFFLPRRYRNPFGKDTLAAYDGPSDPNQPRYDLLITRTSDALGNTVTAQHDYRVLQPKQVSDPNGNRAQAAFDALGMLAGTAVMGKENEPDGQPKGDSLDGFEADLIQDQLDAFITQPRQAGANPNESMSTQIVHDLLGKATTRIVYDLDRYKRLGLPPYAATIVRETHVSGLITNGHSKLQVSFSYSDGLGREIQKKIQAEPGPLVEGGAPVNPRWVGSGWTIFNNKGKPVRQYEPFFDETHAFKFGRQVGVSPILFYDPLERVIATLHPNNTYEKIVFDPWQQSTYDVNDTVKLDPRTDEDVSGYVTEYFKQVAPQPVDWKTWLQQRGVDPLAPPLDTPGLAPEKKAAVRTLPHADTPTVAYFDALGRAFLTIADNGPAGKYETRVELDIENNQRSVTDALARIVMAYNYDMLGAKIHQASMDAGARWMLNDVTGKPIRAWDSRGHEFSHKYDSLRRPIETRVIGGNGPAALDNVYEQIIYGEGQSLNGKNDQELNLRGKAFEHYDTAGKVQFEGYDFKGNLLRSTRKLLQNYKENVNWAQASAPLLEAEPFTSHTTYDALNRPLTATSPDGSVYRPTFNEANLLDKVDVHLRGAALATPFVTNIDYDARGQRTLIAYNQVSHPILTEYTYDKATFRLTSLVTTRPLHSELGKRKLQDLSYTYDPVGNITHILDQAQPRVFFDNDCIDASNDYRYDALYRLLAATGREHKGQDLQPGWDDSPRMGNPIPYNCTENRQYVETYRYDQVGNILQMIHHLGNNLESPGTTIWNRRYQYRPDNNQLRCTSTPGEAALPEYSGAVAQYGERYTYDAHGNMTSMPHLPLMQWNCRDQLQATTQQVVNNGLPETTWYVYDAAGQRVRKVTERQNGTRKDERIYIGGFELYRAYNGASGAVDLERETLHIMDDKRRIALVETRTDTQALEQLIRYQFGNHLGSASLEADDHARVISYEEYHPYGTTSYQAVNKNIKAAAKRYRYTGKERDEESGLSYHGARYYAPWLGRWVSCDPVGIVDGTNLYAYVSGNPLRLIDGTGLAGENISTATPAAAPPATAGTQIYYHVVDFLRQSKVEFSTPQKSFSHVGQWAAEAEFEGFRQSTGASALYGEGVYTFVNEADALAIARAKGGGFPSRPYAVLKFDPATLVEHVTADTGTVYGLAKGPNETVRPADVEWRNFSPAQRQAYLQRHVELANQRVAGTPPASTTIETPALKPAAVEAARAVGGVSGSVARVLTAGPSAATVSRWAQVKSAANATITGFSEVAAGVNKLAILYGASNEAGKSFDAAPGGTLSKLGSAGWTFVLGVAGGAMDNAFIGATFGAGIGPENESWDRHGSGMAQHEIGEMMRKLATW